MKKLRIVALINIAVFLIIVIMNTGFILSQYTGMAFMIIGPPYFIGSLIMSLLAFGVLKDKYYYLGFIASSIIIVLITLLMIYLSI